jgi:lipid-binding SYLF domain-containing protein
MSFFQRFSADAKNSCDDMYSSWVLGDDAGKSAHLTLVLRPSLRTNQVSLGMTFIEINGRAYVKSVAPGSLAARTGVLPEDAVQYATVVKAEFSNDIVEEDEAASQHVLELEGTGLRISYDELRQLLAEALDPTQSAFFSPPAKVASSWNGPPIPSTVNVCVPVDTKDMQPNSPYNHEMPRPVVFCFRRTRQRKSIHQLGMPAFRLDDECDFATLLVKRLAPTNDMEIPPPDTWEELVHDGTDWLLGRGSMLPPKNRMNHVQDDEEIDDPAIPLDDFERIRHYKLAQLRSRMAAEAMQFDRSEDVEAVTIRGMIQKAVGLAFVKASKVVLGVSIHVGSGVVIARLSDGTWSAPSAIGTWGLGLGIQFGLELAEYIFILQTQEALEHFKRGGSFTVGGNMGVAVAGVGREAYGAASVGGGCGTVSTVNDDDDYNDNDSRQQQTDPSSVAIAPIVAYAKSQGLYMGVSVEGSRIYSRDDINSRTYKFGSGRDVTAHDILSGKVPTPREAEELYAALHSVEFTHEMSCLPRPPEILREDSSNAWYYDRSTLGEPNADQQEPFTFLSTMNADESEECQAFEAQFKNFMYGGVSVTRLLPDTESRSGRTGKERRTLWLMLPEVGSLRLGFVSKLSDGEVHHISNKSSTQRSRRDDPSRVSNFDGDVGTVGSEDVTLDSALNTRVSYCVYMLRERGVF